MIWVLLLVVALAGCQPPSTAGTNSGGGFARSINPAHDPGSGQLYNPEVLTAKDRCPAQLHEIAGALFEYYVDHRKLPDKFDELSHYTDTPLTFVCPESHQPYVYVPAGLRKPGGTKRIIVHDPVRHADGTRWCIVISDGKPGAAQAAEVVQLPEPLFLAYQ
jgi:hypothetical protein